MNPLLFSCVGLMLTSIAMLFGMAHRWRIAFTLHGIAIALTLIGAIVNLKHLYG